jgi:hypothetical protein
MDLHSAGRVAVAAGDRIGEDTAAGLVIEGGPVGTP